MCAMTRQPEAASVVLLTAFGVTIAACGLDKQGTQFTTLERESPLDGGIATTQGRPDAAAGEASHEVAQGLAPASLDASTPAPVAEAASSHGPGSAEGSRSSLDASLEAASSDDAGPDRDAADAGPPATGSSCDQDAD